MPPNEKGRRKGDPIPNFVLADVSESKSVLLKKQAFRADHAVDERESKLWQEVQLAYAASRDYRAGNNAEYAKALAAWAQFANADDRPSNVLPFKRPGAK
jgi:hypothetical protein